jgi:RNA polymerase sigma-70 factor, ECF subfamily
LNDEKPADAAEASQVSASVAGTDDREIALRAQRGDLRATEDLVKRHQESVSRLLWRFVRTKSDLDDLVQETFLRMVRALPTWKAEQPFNHWLLRIATNVGRDYFRRQSVRRRWVAEPSATTLDDSPEPEAVEMSPDPAARAAANEAKALLAHLSPDDRALLTLYHLEGWGLPQIAAQYGWTVTATKLRAFRARRQLRALLSENDTL